jgi:hypothetical protein
MDSTARLGNDRNAVKYLDAVFWDYPEFTDPATIRWHLDKQGNQGVRRWLLTRLLEHGRVVDTLAFFPLKTISAELSDLNLRPYTHKKWTRILDVYGQSAGK